MNYQLKFDIKKLNRAFVYGIQGKTEKVDCICIPVSEFYPGKNGELYCSFDIKEKNSPGAYGDTHFAKHNMEKASYQKLTEEQKKTIPIIGNMKPSSYIERIETVTPEEVTRPQRNDDLNGGKDLPF